MADRPHLTYRTVFSTPWFTIEESAPLEHATGAYYRMTGPDGVICLPLTVAGDIVMVRQYRPSLNMETLEIPAGAIDGTEPPLEASQREVLEETGYHCREVHSLGTGRFYPNRLIQREFMFLGLGAEPRIRADVEPGLATVLMPRKQFLAMARNVEIDQTAIYFLLGMVTARFGVDLLRAPIEEIHERVRLDATTG
ncbi:MAG: NUDIX hydrolase [Reyranella sp.]|uniref:NUDIX hydrolase n=1 Tax=Reyranella sp. TaxID=1929291 RepID=UPI002730F545|nr:NUDIX hydrolase [Reyranella sp.]MDP1963542.1 NUDIX hydrolase [Reyranella sp.]MDP2377431.1 NUDIX hydrolase [Reyranella sp.]